jgi:hypothetical protein
VPDIVVEEFTIDEDNTEKFWWHGISSGRVLEVLESPFRIKRNRNAR